MYSAPGGLAFGLSLSRPSGAASRPGLCPPPALSGCVGGMRGARTTAGAQASHNPLPVYVMDVKNALERGHVAAGDQPRLRLPLCVVTCIPRSRPTSGSQAGARSVLRQRPRTRTWSGRRLSARTMATGPEEARAGARGPAASENLDSRRSRFPRKREAPARHAATATRCGTSKQGVQQTLLRSTAIHGVSRGLK